MIRFFAEMQVLTHYGIFHIKIFWIIFSCQTRYILLYKFECDKELSRLIIFLDSAPYINLVFVIRLTVTRLGRAKLQEEIFWPWHHRLFICQLLALP